MHASQQNLPHNMHIQEIRAYPHTPFHLEISWETRVSNVKLNETIRQFVKVGLAFKGVSIKVEFIEPTGKTSPTDQTGKPIFPRVKMSRPSGRWHGEIIHSYALSSPLMRRVDCGCRCTSRNLEIWIPKYQSFDVCVDAFVQRIFLQVPMPPINVLDTSIGIENRALPLVDVGVITSTVKFSGCLWYFRWEVPW